MDWMIDCMGGFRTILSKSSGNRFLHSSFYMQSSILLASIDLRGRRLGALALSNESGI